MDVETTKAINTLSQKTIFYRRSLKALSIEFPTPIRGTAATLLEVVTLSASITGAVFFNAQGYAAP